MKQVLEHLSKHKTLKTIKGKLTQKQNIYINNTNEDNALLVLLSMYKQLNQNFFIVTPNLYTSQLIYDKLSRVLEKDEINFYPQDEFLTNELLVSSSEFRLERINTIDKLMNNKPRVVITNLYGVLKPQFSQTKWKNAMITLHKGETYSLDALKDRLINYGYNHQYTVEKIGDFALRGGILDIFPINSDNPFRLDFFGDELEVIKTFDLDTQRSIDTVPSFRLTPMTDFFYTDEEYEHLENKIQEKLKVTDLSNESINMVKDDLSKLKDREELDRLSRYLPFMTEKHNTILDLVDESKVMYLDYHRVLEQNTLLIEEIKEWYDQTNDYPKMGFNLIY
ncbi:MAG: hypothetical protein PF513_03210, partial [Tenericutes bacterium]|nr:hypothetical protein [Mycoplasmatota bacterium]